MFIIKNNIIYITRGDSGVIELSVDNYTFSVGDTVELRVYEKKGLDKVPILSKIVEVSKDGETIDIELTAEETKIGEFENREKEYWYEIELNNKHTIIGYDENGPKLLILYPEGRESDDTNEI